MGFSTHSSLLTHSLYLFIVTVCRQSLFSTRRVHPAPCRVWCCKHKNHPTLWGLIWELKAHYSHHNYPLSVSIIFYSAGRSIKITLLFEGHLIPANVLSLSTSTVSCLCLPLSTILSGADGKSRLKHVVIFRMSKCLEISLSFSMKDVIWTVQEWTEVFRYTTFWFR